MDRGEIAHIVDAVRERQRFVVSSHARPDGDAIGSELAMAYALRALGKDVRVVNKDRAPDPYHGFPGVPDIEIADSVDETFDAAIIMECSDLARTGVSGLERSFVINIDHHPGNGAYGQINWLDQTAAACGEMVFDLIIALGTPLTREIATHVYVAILTDTGSFHYSSITPRTFTICRTLLSAGIDPVAIARQVYDSNSVARLRLIASVLGGMEIDASGRVAVLYVDHAMTRAAGGTYDDTEGLINEPLTVKDIQAVVLFKQNAGTEYRVSMRSKGQVDIGAVARTFGGGGHKNAAGCTVVGDLGELRQVFLDKLRAAIDSPA